MKSNSEFNVQARQKLLVITGPTASGKSRLAMELGKRFDGELINADSVQVYRDFDIGSGKPNESELRQLPHHLLSYVEPTDGYDVGRFVKDATSAISLIASREKLPILVGGTGLYIKSLLCGLAELEPISDEVTNRIEHTHANFISKGLDEREIKLSMYQWLCSIDPDYAAVVHPANLQRVKRGLAVKLQTGDSMTQIWAHTAQAAQYEAFVVVLMPKRTSLYEAIDSRVEQMLQLGLLEEVKALLAKYPHSAQPFDAIGYRHLKNHCLFGLALDEAVRLLKRDTRRFAKRQITWWRHQPEKCGWRDSGADEVLALVSGFIGNARGGECETSYLLYESY